MAVGYTVLAMRKMADIRLVLMTAAVWSIAGCNRQHAVEQFELDVVQPDLEHFAAEAPQALRRYLQASAEWEVIQEGENVVAYRRVSEAGGWRRPPNGYVSKTYPEIVQTRFLFRFAEEGGGPFRNAANRAFLTVLEPQAGRTQISVSRPSYMFEGSRLESYIAVGRPGLWFEFFEEREGLPRPSTVQALRWLSEFLAGVRSSEATIREQGAAPILPAGSVKKGAPELRVHSPELTPAQAVSSAGQHELTAWVNPGEQGCLYSRSVNRENGAVLHTSSRCEFTGWSDNPSQLFHYYETLRVGRGAPYGTYQAGFEVWLRPSIGGLPRRLISKDLFVQGWYR